MGKVILSQLPLPCQQQSVVILIIIIKADTNYVKDYDYPVVWVLNRPLDVIDKIPFYDQAAVLEFKDEGNNEKINCSNH